MEFKLETTYTRPTPWWVRVFRPAALIWPPILAVYTVAWLLVGRAAAKRANLPDDLIFWLAFAWAPLAMGFFVWSDLVGRFYLDGLRRNAEMLRDMLQTTADKIEDEMRESQGLPPREARPTVN